MAIPESRRPKGLRIHDLVGLVVGYGMAALLVRAIWPGSKPFSGISAIALGFEYCWLGLAMSGPIILLIDRRRGAATDGQPRRRGRPERPGRLISTGEPAAPPVGRGPSSISTEPPPTFTRAELAWMVIGGYWIALTLFVVPARSMDTPWAMIGLLQVVAALGLWMVVPRRIKPGNSAESWTHPAALGLLWTWPFAWVFLVLLGRTL